MAKELSLNHYQPNICSDALNGHPGASQTVGLEWKGTSLCSLFVQIKYILGTFVMLSITASLFYCIPEDGWCACDIVIYRPSVFCGRALERIADIQPALWRGRIKADVLLALRKRE